MSKVKLVCNHCGCQVEWYSQNINEIGLTKIDNKLYCEVCLKKIAHICIDNR